MGSGSLMLNGREVGRVVWSVSGRAAEVRAQCPFENGYIYRVNLHCGERKEYLGIMQPDGTRFSLRKRLTGGAHLLSAAGAEPVAVITRTRPGEAVTEYLGPPLSQRAENDFLPLEQTDFLAEGALKEIISRKANILYREDAGVHLLAFPFAPGEETNFSAYLSSSECMQIDGNTYGVLRISNDGQICG